MKTLIKLSCILAVAVFTATLAHAQTLSLLTDDFNSYTSGSVLPSPWTLFSGSGGEIASNGQAFVSGGSTGGGDMGITFGTNSVGPIFAAFDVTIASWAQSGTPAYFAMFKDATTFNFFARTFVTNVVGGVQFGVATGSALPPTWSSTVSIGSTNRLTIELDQSGPSNGVNMVASLFLNGSLVGSSYTMLNSNVAISQFALRQSNATTEGNLFVDNLDVYTIPEPSTMLLVGTGLVGLLLYRRRRS